MNKSRKIIAFLTALVLFTGMASILLPEEVFPMTGAMAAGSPDKAPTTDPTGKGGFVTEKKKVQYKGAYYIIMPNGEATYMGPVKETVISVTIPGTITIGGARYKVTRIGAKAFKGCKKLKTIKIKSPYLNAVSKTAFKGLKKSQVKKIEIKYTKKMKKVNLKKLKKALKKVGVSVKKIKKLT